MRKAGVILLLLACSLPFGCRKAADPAPVHELTAQEQVKEHLVSSFSPFVAALELEKIYSIPDYLLVYGRLDLDTDHTPRFRLVKDGLTLLSLRLAPGSTHWDIQAAFYGGISLEGRFTPSLSWDWHDWEEHWDIQVYDGGEAVARLGLEDYEGKPVPVFRFPDGTSYSVTTLLLTEALVDYLLTYVISTE